MAVHPKAHLLVDILDPSFNVEENYRVYVATTTDYYRRLLQGQGRLEAMEQAAQAMRAQHPHPYFWAPFVLAGKVAQNAALN